MKKLHNQALSNVCWTRIFILLIKSRKTGCVCRVARMEIV